MNEPIVLANENLVLNGDFEEGLSHWKKGPVNGDWVGTVEEMHEGFLIRLLEAGNQASVSQALKIPQEPGAQARYVISFLCEMRHTEAGKLVIGIDGVADELEIPLRPGKLRDLEEDQARLKSGQPLAFNPIEYQVDLDLPFHSQDTITVSVFSPANEVGDDWSRVCITRIKLELHLEPPVMQRLTLDEEQISPSQTLHLCLGASATFAHRLKFDLTPGSAWLGTKAALTSNDNPLGAIVAKPAWGVDHPLEEQWQLDCPWIGDEGPYFFSMKLHNQYTAEPYPVNVSLGHHRLVFSDAIEAAHYPVLEYGQSVCLGVKVASHYTAQPLSGRTVNWTLVGQGVKAAVITNNEGWAYFDYQPTEQGDFDIEASVESLYYVAGVVTQTFAVRVLETDPWKDVLVVADGGETRWEEKTGYPNRGADYPVKIKLASGSPLSGTQLSLHWSGDSHVQLGVAVSPALEHPVPVTGTESVWTLTSEDRLDGQFDLSLACSKLLLPSPKKRMSLARNLVKVGQVREANKFPVVDEQESVLLRVQVMHVIASGDGGAVVNALVDWKTPLGTVPTVTGAGGWASLLYTPNSAGDQFVTASIKAHAEAVAVEQRFEVKPVATSPWKNEVKIFLDGKEVDRATLGVLCRRGQTHTLKVVPVSGSGWIGKNISLHWRGAAPNIGLVPSDLGTPKLLEAAGAEWKLVSQANNSISSLFELELRLEGVSTVRELSGRLMSADLTEEVSLLLDQTPAALDGETLHPCLGACHRFSVLPNALSPLVGLMSSLTWTGDKLGATVEPDLNSPQVISDGGAIWKLDFTESQQPGEFALTLALPQLDFVATAKPMVLAHNKVRIGAWRESPVDPVVGQDPAWMWVQVFSHFTGHAVDEVPVTWSASDIPSVVKTDAYGWSGFAFAPADAHSEHEVEALVENPYDGYSEKRAMTTTALESDPWEGMMLSFDKQPFQPWGQKTYFPRRKGEHTIDLMASSNSPLFGHELTLGMTGTGPSELGISFLSDGLGVPRPFYEGVGLQYLFKVGDLKDGSFALRLSSQRLASLSPASAMSLGEGSQVLKIIASNSVKQTLDWGQELVEQVTVVSVISERPMVGVTVTWRSPDLGIVTSVTDFYGVAKISFIPTHPGPAQLTATVGAALNAESITLDFTLNEPRQIAELLEVAGTEQEPVRVRVKVVSSRTGEPLPGVSVMWELNESRLPSGVTDGDGFAWLGFTLAVEQKNTVVAMVEGGRGGWDMAVLGLNQVMVPVIESLTCDRIHSFTGYNVTAQALVLDSDSGKPLRGIRINWSFAGQALPDSTSDASGIARMTFETRDVGEFDLVASLALGLPGAKTQRVRVEQLPTVLLRDIDAKPNVIQIYKPSYISAHVVKEGGNTPVAGILVRWKVNGYEILHSYSDEQGGVQYRHAAPEPGEDVITATVDNPVGTVTVSTTVLVTY